jgi:hypothetical protein
MGLGEMGLGEMVLGEMVLGDMDIHRGQSYKKCLDSLVFLSTVIFSKRRTGLLYSMCWKFLHSKITNYVYVICIYEKLILSYWKIFLCFYFPNISL